MTRIRSILAVTDFSVHALHAAERAALIAARSAAERGTVLHVLEATWLDSMRHFLDLPPDVEEGVVEESRQALVQLASRLRQFAGVALEPQVLVGNVLDRILEQAGGYDLLALGVRGSHPVREFAVGTLVQRLLRRTTKPVLVVKRKPAGAYQRVLVAVDFSPHAGRALAFAPAIAPEAAEICLVHVFEAPFEGKMFYAGIDPGSIDTYRTRARLEAERQMKHFIDESGLVDRPLVPIVEHGYPPGRLRDKSRELEADLVVVGKHGKSLTEQLLLGSITQHLLAEAHCDVLVVQ